MNPLEEAGPAIKKRLNLIVIAIFLIIVGMFGSGLGFMLTTTTISSTPYNLLETIVLIIPRLSFVLAAILYYLAFRTPKTIQNEASRTEYVTSLE